MFRMVSLIGLLIAIAAPAFAQPEKTKTEDLLDLLEDKKVELKAQGSGIQSVSLEIRSTQQQRITVRIPAGTFFVANNRSTQNMVATREQIVILPSEGSKTIVVQAACANRPKDIPEKGSGFSVTRAANQKELQTLMAALGKASVSYPIQQAAIWIVTDDANFQALGTLVRRGPGGASARIINAYEAGSAMKLCDDAGIDVARKAIWRDRQTILNGLPDGALADWLRKPR